MYLNQGIYVSMVSQSSNKRRKIQWSDISLSPLVLRKNVSIQTLVRTVVIGYKRPQSVPFRRDDYRILIAESCS